MIESLLKNSRISHQPLHVYQCDLSLLEKHHYGLDKEMLYRSIGIFMRQMSYTHLFPTRFQEPLPESELADINNFLRLWNIEAVSEVPLLSENKRAESFLAQAFEQEWLLLNPPAELIPSSCRLAFLRVYYAWAIASPGKKVSVMGDELGISNAELYSLDQYNSFLNKAMHRNFRIYTAELNSFYLRTASLWEQDFKDFSFVINSDCHFSTEAPFSFSRKAFDGSFLVCVFNFSQNDCDNFTIPVPRYGSYRCCFASDYLNLPVSSTRVSRTDPHITVCAPALSAAFYRCDSIVI